MAFSEIESIAGTWGVGSASATFSATASAGELLIGYVGIYSAADVSGVSVPAGWTFGEAHQESNRTIAIYYKVANGSETDFSITHSDGAESVSASAARYSFSGSLGAVTSVTGKATNQTSVDVGPVTTASGRLLVLLTRGGSPSVASSAYSNGFVNTIPDIPIDNATLFAADKIAGSASESVTHTLTESVTRLSAVLVSFEESAATPTISNVDGDNAVNQYQLCNINVADFDEVITNVTINAVAVESIPDNDPTDDVIQVRMPGSLATGSYDVVVSGATETDTISGISYTQTHPVQLPTGAVDSNSILSGQTYDQDGSVYMDNAAAPYEITGEGGSAVGGGETMSFAGGYTDWSDAPLANDVDDYLAAPASFTGWMRSDHVRIYSDATTDAWSVEYEIVDGAVVSARSLFRSLFRAPGANVNRKLFH